MLKFANNVNVYVDGELLPGVTAVHVTFNRDSEERECNQVTIFYSNRCLTVGLESVEFENDA